MKKCHCGNIFFEEVYQYTLKTGKNLIDSMRELGAGIICTACVQECQKYYETRNSEIMYSEARETKPIVQIS